MNRVSRQQIHMLSSRAPIRRRGFGAQGQGGTSDPVLLSAVQAMLGGDPCAAVGGSPPGSVQAFQAAWNANLAAGGDMAGGPVGALTVDGKYGPQSSAAASASNGSNVPASCVFCGDGSVHQGGYQCPAPAPPGPAGCAPGQVQLPDGTCVTPINCPQGQIVDPSTGNCMTPPAPGPSPSGGSSSNTGLIIAAVLAAIGLGGGIAYYSKKKHPKHSTR